MNPCDGGRAHHFVLETPHDGQRMVNGVCRICGVAKQFPAGYEEDPIRRSKPDGAMNRRSSYFTEDKR